MFCVCGGGGDERMDSCFIIFFERISIPNFSSQCVKIKTKKKN